MGVFALIKQLAMLVVAVIFIAGIIIALGTMFPNGELGSGFGELTEGLGDLISAAVDGISGPV